MIEILAALLIGITGGLGIFYLGYWLPLQYREERRKIIESFKSKEGARDE